VTRRITAETNPAYPDTYRENRQRGRIMTPAVPAIDPAAITLPPTQPIDITELIAQSTPR